MKHLNHNTMNRGLLLLALTILALRPCAADDSAPRLVPRTEPSPSVVEAEGLNEGSAETAPRLVIHGEDDGTESPATSNEGDTGPLLDRLLAGTGSFTDEYRAALHALVTTPDVIGALVSLALGDEVEPGRRAYATLRDAVFGAGTTANHSALAQNLLAALPKPQKATPAVPVVSPAPATLWEAVEGFAAAAAGQLQLESPEPPESRYLDGFHLQVQRDLLRWAGSIASDDLSGAIAAYLADPKLAGAAVAALAQIPGPAAASALAGALPAADADTQVRIAEALGDRQQASATEALIALARATSAKPVFWAALDALAAQGQPPTVAGQPGPEFGREEVARFAQYGLKAAQVLEDRGDLRSAERIYLSFMNLYSRRSHLRAALLGLARVDSAALFQQAMGFMSTPGVRESALEALATAQIANVDNQLASAFYVTDPSMRAGILEVLRRRKSSLLEDLLPAALLSDSLELRLAAADLAGIQMSDQDLMKLAREGNPWVRLDALRRYLARAEARVETGQVDAARIPLLQVAQGPFPAFERIRAIELLAAYDDEEVAAIVQKLTEDPTVADAAYRVGTAISTAAPEGNSQANLQGMAERAETLETAAIAAAALEAQGQSTKTLAQRWGFITDWRVLGPLPEFNTAYFVETAERPPELVRLDDSALEWVPAAASGVPSVLELAGARGEAYYLSAAVAIPQWMTVELRLGSSAPSVVWLNGEQVHATDDQRVLEADDDLVHVALRPGVNRVLVKVAIPETTSHFTARLTDRAGKPIDLSNQAMPDDGMSGVGNRPNALLTTISEDAP